MPENFQGGSDLDWENLVEGVDYYYEGKYVVYTEAFHLKRGECCNSGCRHCPYRNSDPDYT